MTTVAVAATGTPVPTAPAGSARRSVAGPAVPTARTTVAATTAWGDRATAGAPMVTAVDPRASVVGRATTGAGQQVTVVDRAMTVVPTVAPRATRHVHVATTRVAPAGATRAVRAAGTRVAALRRARAGSPAAVTNAARRRAVRAGRTARATSGAVTTVPVVTVVVAARARGTTDGDMHREAEPAGSGSGPTSGRSRGTPRGRRFPRTSSSLSSTGPRVVACGR